ncbi:MAG: anti-sigma factor [Cereibacter sphaeroides]|uniref:Anti-sigma factor n=1 Tax=Cereibacter sphaeroides TaxID=1063 RepID=A0A2W5SI17_CERSP|nr:MAG: anti-sigma factor [Cereibacter sphaeroides]
MSDLATPPPPDDDADMLAAEFVLGVLPLEERVLAAARIQSDAGFAEQVTVWQNRLAHLNAAYVEASAPNVLPRIEARLFPTRPKPLFGRRWLLLGGAMAAALLAAVFLQPQQPPPPMLTATLSDPSQVLSFNARFDPGRDELTLVHTAGTPPAAGQDLELWAIGAEGTPRPLGLVRGTETVIAEAGLVPGLVLAVSLEPEGGSPTGLPTGPVLVTGVLSQ